MNSKENIRAEMKKRRREFEDKLSASKKICENILSMAEYKNASCVAVYMAAFGEADLSLIIKDQRKRGRYAAVPITNPQTNEVVFSYADGEFSKGAYGIYEPKHFELAEFDKIDFICVPGVAFDKRLNRIGFGKGCYDRVLNKMRAFKCGVCYDFQTECEIVCGAHDIKMDAVVSEKSIYR